MTPCSTTSSSAENPDYVEVGQHAIIMNNEKNVFVVMKKNYDQCNVRHILCVTVRLNSLTLRGKFIRQVSLVERAVACGPWLAAISY